MVTLAEYKQAREPREFKTPSGLTFVVHVLSLRQLLEANAAPGFLREIAMSKVDPKADSRAKVQEKFEEDPVNFFRMIDSVCVAATRGVISEKETEDEDKIFVGLLDEQTKIAIFTEALSLASDASKDLAPFRKKPGSADPSADGEVLGGEAEPVSEPSTGGTGGVRPGRSPDDSPGKRGEEKVRVPQKREGTDWAGK